MKTVHLVFNAHLDPVWLWPWQAGVDELLATCRTACDLLERHPDLVFSRGEAWVYRQIERIEPRLFARIEKLVAAGRWEIVGGWWIQPDCNLPSGFALEKQIALGREYFTSRFGFFPEVGYNVDSFGHAATLPSYLAAAGQKYYVMMRPQEHEKTLPARLFRWRGDARGPEVTAFRIAGSYLTGTISIAHVEKALTALPPGVEETMCFVGLGDHGGGPTEKQIAWCREHATAIPGARLVFSSPSRFFKAVARSIPRLPLVVGELQHHAVGCYTVTRAIKTAVRRAEHLLAQAEGMRAGLGRGHDLPDLTGAWEQVCFNHFHDTLAGTCIPSANRQAADQLGAAAATADEVLQTGLRIRLRTLPPDREQRLVVHNPSRRPFDGYVEHEPWLDWQPWGERELIDERGRPVPVQLLATEAVTNGLVRILFRAAIPPGSDRVFRLRQRGKAPATARPPRAAIGAAPGGRLRFGPAGTLRLALELIDDPTDTWSHGIDRYGERALAKAKWNAPLRLDRGPLRTSFLQTGTVSSSEVRAEYRTDAGQPWIDLILDVDWRERRKVLKLCLHGPRFTARRLDGISGGSLIRANGGAEQPLRDWTRLPTRDGKIVGIVCPDVYALDATEARVRLTLLRSPLAAHHDPNPGTEPRAAVTDRGLHRFRFRFYLGKSLSAQRLDDEALHAQQPPLCADVTRGMPARPAGF